MRKLIFALALAAALPVTGAVAADVKMGAAKSEACAACHGANGVSVSADIPNLAGQKDAYLVGQLKAFRDGSRKNALMNAIAEQLSDDDIADLAAFWNGLPPAGGTQMSDMIPEINKTRVAFPADYKATFTYYTTINFEAKKQVRRYYANPEAVAAARAGKPMGDGAYFFVEVFKAKVDDTGKLVKGADGFLVPASDKPIFFTAMQIGDGWGNDVPDIYRNGDWNYAVFKGDGSLNTGINQAKCFACHKPLDKDSYVFSIDALASVVK